MKQETKELIDWIKKQIALSGTIVTDISQPNWQVDKEKAVEFLDSLPEIENKLCFGGYIQDKNGTPCCNGDKVKVIDEKGENICGILVWGDTSKSFSIQNAKLRQVYYLPVQFEKVEK